MTPSLSENSGYLNAGLIGCTDTDDPTMNPVEHLTIQAGVTAGDNLYLELPAVTSYP